MDLLRKLIKSRTEQSRKLTNIFILNNSTKKSGDNLVLFPNISKSAYSL